MFGCLLFYRHPYDTDNLISFFSYDHMSDACVAETDGHDCYVYKGEMTVLHDGSVSEELVQDDVLASVEGSMTSGELAGSIEDVERVSYLGDSLEDVETSLGPEETVVEYYYTVETKPGANPDDFTAAVEDGLLDSVTRDVVDASVGGISSEPVDMELTECKSLRCVFLVRLLTFLSPPV